MALEQKSGVRLGKKAFGVQNRSFSEGSPDCSRATSRRSVPHLLFSCGPMSGPANRVRKALNTTPNRTGCDLMLTGGWKPEDVAAVDGLSTFPKSLSLLRRPVWADESDQS
jgi:hypothetical protein